MGWRDDYNIHPAADVFPMMSDAELDALGEDIKANGLTIPVLFWNGDGKGRILIDGRNRLEACERVGIDPDDVLMETFICKDPVTHIITLNIHRRHLAKQQQADLIVAAVKAGEKPVQVEPVSDDGGMVELLHPCGSPTGLKITKATMDELERGARGGRGKKNLTKEKAIAAGAKHGISESTIKRAIAKVEMTPEEIEARRQKIVEQDRRREEQTRERREYKQAHKLRRESDVAAALAILQQLDFDTAQRLVTLLMNDAVACDVSIALVEQEIERDDEKQASTLPPQPRSEVGVDDCTLENCGVE